MRTAVRRLVKVCVVVAITVLAVPAWAQTPPATGTWELYPPQTNAYATTVQQPINADGTSNFKANGKGVIPVQFKLSVVPGPVTFQSIGTDAGTNNDYSYLSFTPSPSSPLTFAQVTELRANYTFLQGNCHGGSLRWS